MYKHRILRIFDGTEHVIEMVRGLIRVRAARVKRLECDRVQIGVWLD